MLKHKGLLVESLQVYTIYLIKEVPVQIFEPHACLTHSLKLLDFERCSVRDMNKERDLFSRFIEEIQQQQVPSTSFWFNVTLDIQGH